jgi:hypothetical protein
MHKAWLLSLAGALLLALADHHPAGALPADQHGLITTFGNGPNAPLAEFTQRRGRGVVIRGRSGRRAVAVRGPYGRRAVAVRGPYRVGGGITVASGTAPGGVIGPVGGGLMVWAHAGG